MAKLFCTSSNLLVLDEPTNDLDVETLELLEDRLLEYSGTILLVSHDRTFLNNVVTSTIVLEGEGRMQEYVGGYDDWLRQRAEIKETLPKEVKGKKEKQPRDKSKLSFKEIKEREELPRRIEKMEKTKAGLMELLNSPDLYKTNNPTRVLDVNNQLAALEIDLETAYNRWDELEEMAAKFANC